MAAKAACWLAREGKEAKYMHQIHLIDVLVRVRGPWRPPLSQTAAVGGGMQEGAMGAKGSNLNQRPLPTPPEQQDSMESTAGGASESFGIESTTQKTVSRQFVRCSDVWNLPGASPRRFEPNRSSICSSAARKPPPTRPSACVPSATRPFGLV